MLPLGYTTVASVIKSYFCLLCFVTVFNYIHTLQEPLRIIFYLSQ